MAILFSAAAAYLVLKIGQVSKQPYPIAIIAVGLPVSVSKKRPRRKCADSIHWFFIGVIVAGAIFTLPPCIFYRLNIRNE
jgi:hypothetical protein